MLSSLFNVEFNIIELSESSEDVTWQEKFKKG